MSNKRTVAHWGSYRVEEESGGPALHPDENDPSPSVIGDSWIDAMQDEKVRILKPAVRKGWLLGDKGKNRNDDEFIEVSWERALDLASSEIKRIISTYGNSAVYGGSYGWSSAGRFNHAQSQLRRFLNLSGGHVGKADTYSHAALEVLLPHLMGLSMGEYQDQMTTWPLIAEHCTLFLSFGGIATRTAQISSGGNSLHELPFWLKRAEENGMQIINVSPQRSDMDTPTAARWVPIRPGTDTACILALCYEILKGGLQDELFLTRYTSGWETFREYLTGKTDGIVKDALWASELCDIPAEYIRSLALRLPHEKVLVNVAWSLQRADHGEQPLWAALALASMLGQIGQRGTGIGFGYGSMGSIGMPVKKSSWPSFPSLKNPVSDFIPVARIADMLMMPSQTYQYNGETRTYPDIRLVYWVGGNPFHHHQDLFRLEEAWTRPQTVIVHEHSWTSTARRADIVLPATCALEREDLFINPRDPSLVFMNRILDPIGEARDDYEIFSLLASRMGFREKFTEGRTPDEWLEWLWDECRERAQQDGYTLPDYEMFRRTGRIDIPAREENRNLLEAFIADPVHSPLKTESGKITLSNENIASMKLHDCPGHPLWLPPLEWLGDAEEGELHLISPQPYFRLHSQLDNGRESRKRKISQREPCLLHPQTAQRFKLTEGDLVRIYNERGSCLAGVMTEEGIRKDCLALATGAWFSPQDIDGKRIDVHGNPNSLTIDKGTSSLAQGNIGHTALVRIEKWDKPLPDVTVFYPPRFTSEVVD